MVRISKLFKIKEGYLLECPGCGHAHLYNDKWQFNGDMNNPTFTPSYLSKYRHPKGYDNNNPAPIGYIGEDVEEICHSFVTNGRIQFLSDCTHNLAGKIIDFPNIE